ncbi:MAG TPA: SRPBCC domain-containing protein [Bradyrhizobium sp.]|nr:SRPBCC domain-containing protein [Bradyrhizobium sp.]
MPNILHRVGIAAEPARVFEALGTVEGIKNWWSSETHGDASVGGAFQFRKNRFEVVHADPSLVVWRYSGPAEDWVGTEIRFRLEWRDDQTFVLFSHEGWREPNEFMHHCSTKWATFLLSLKDLVENGEGRPEPRDTKIAANG